jgi:hypothetical protein
MDNSTQMIQNSSASVSATSTQVLPAVSGSLVRSQLIITNTSAAAVVTIAKGEISATAGAGIRITPGSSYLESTDSGFRCWQGSVQAVADAAGTVAIVQSFQ